MTRVGIATAIVVVASWVSVMAVNQAAQKMEYDVYCKLPDLEAKRAAFFAASPENRAELVRTQIERWRDANRARLNAKQVQYLAELLAGITPESYGEGPKSEEVRIKMREMLSKQVELFTREDILAMQPNAPCIAKSTAPVE